MRAIKVLFPIVFGITITFGVLLGIASASYELVSPASPSAVIIYVDVNANGTATGFDWTNAYTNLQDALAVALSGNQVWVARGVYYPDLGAGQTDDNVESTFTLTDGVALYGGFDPASGVDEFAERDWDKYRTVLSGDIDHETDPDITDSYGVVTTTANINGRNAYHVVSCDGVTNTAVIDGFAITAGYVNGDYPDFYGGGINNINNSSPSLTDVIFSGNWALGGGGGMSNRINSSPTLNRVTFTGNYADEGGGMYNARGSNPALTNVIFLDNSADYIGGGMVNRDSSPRLNGVTFAGNSGGTGGGLYNVHHSDPVLNNVTFSCNSAGRGGGMYSYTSNPTLTEVTFSGNSVRGNGGGLFIVGGNPMLNNVAFSGNSADEGGGMSSLISHPTLTNLTFSGNRADHGGGLYNDKSNLILINVTLSSNSADYSGGGMYNFKSSPVLTNVILWGNSAFITGTSQISNTETSIPVINYSDIQGSGGSGAGWVPDLGSDGGGNIDADPHFRRNPGDGGDGWGDDPGTPDVDEAANDDYGDLRLRFSSPAIDTGTNLGCPGIDLDGKLRPINNTCDMGAYEASFSMILIYLPLLEYPSH